MGQLEDRRRQLERFKQSGGYVDPEVQLGDRPQGPGAGEALLTQIAAGGAGAIHATMKLLAAGPEGMRSLGPVDEGAEMVEDWADESLGDYAASTPGGSPLALFGIEQGGRATGALAADAAMGGAVGGAVKAGRGARAAGGIDDAYRAINTKLKSDYPTPRWQGLDDLPDMPVSEGLGMDQKFQELLNIGLSEEDALRMLLDG